MCWAAKGRYAQPLLSPFCPRIRLLKQTRVTFRVSRDHARSGFSASARGASHRNRINVPLCWHFRPAEPMQIVSSELKEWARALSRIRRALCDRRSGKDGLLIRAKFLENVIVDIARCKLSRWCLTRSRYFDRAGDNLLQIFVTSGRFQRNDVIVALKFKEIILQFAHQIFSYRDDVLIDSLHAAPVEFLGVYAEDQISRVVSVSFRKRKSGSLRNYDTCERRFLQIWSYLQRLIGGTKSLVDLHKSSVCTVNRFPDISLLPLLTAITGALAIFWRFRTRWKY